MVFTLKQTTKLSGFKTLLWVETAAVLLLTVWVKFPYVFYGVSKKVLFEHLIVIASIWAIVAVGSRLLFTLLNRGGQKPYSIRLRLIAVATLVAGLLTAVVSCPSLLPKHDHVTVDIIAGQRTKSPQASGSEVYLSWCENAYKQLKLSQQPLIKQLNFEYIENSDAYAYRNSDGSGMGLLRFAFPGDEQLTLRFANSEWSGVVKIINHATGESTELDLYTSADGEAFQSYSILPGPPLALWKKLGLLALYTLCFSAIIQGLVFAGIVLTHKARPVLTDKRRVGQVIRRHAVSGLVVAFVPMTVLLFLYGKNSAYVDFVFLMMLACAITALLLLYYALVDLAYCSPLSGTVAGIIMILFLFCYPLVSRWLEVPNVSLYLQSNAALLIGGLCAVLTLLCFMPAKNRQVSRFISLFSGLFVGILFIFNLVNSIAIYSHQSNLSQSLIKQTYCVEERHSSEKPNVYWLHFDGMLGFSTVEKYFGDPLTDFEQALADRGVMVNRHASFMAGHQTFRCLPALLSPEFYDFQYATWQQAHQQDPAVTLDDFFSDISVATMQTQQINAELFTAFKAADYQFISMVESNLDGIIIMAGEVQYTTPNAQLLQSTVKTPGSAQRLASEAAKLSQIKAFCEAFMMPASLVIDVESFKENNYIQKNIMTLEADRFNTTTCQALAHVSSEADRPFICFVPFMQAHVPYYLDENGLSASAAVDNGPLGYFPQYKYASKVMLQAIDSIKRNDPDAVIVIQADHGINASAEEIVAAFGQQVDISEILDSTMSAIRVPEKYQNGEEAYALQNPLNMSRYLVNNFVGHNYTYLAQQ